jgi:hypothetical protein
MFGINLFYGPISCQFLNFDLGRSISFEGNSHQGSHPGRREKFESSDRQSLTPFRHCDNQVPARSELFWTRKRAMICENDDHITIKLEMIFLHLPCLPLYAGRVITLFNCLKSSTFDRHSAKPFGIIHNPCDSRLFHTQTALRFRTESGH